MRKLLIIAVVLAMVATPATVAVVSAMPNSDIVFTFGGLTSARLHTATQGYGPGSYDVKSDGTGTITFYKRARSGPAGYPRGAVLEFWTYQLGGTERNFPGASYADSASVTSWGTAKEVIVTGIPQ